MSHTKKSTWRSVFQPNFMALVLSCAGLGSALGQAPADAPGAQVSAPHEAVGPVAAPSTLGEVRRIDLANQKITLRHEAITPLNMPPMTMVFRVADPVLLQDLKTGDAVRFVAEKRDGAYWVTELRRAP